MIQKRKLKGIADTPFGPKRFYSYIDNLKIKKIYLNLA